VQAEERHLRELHEDMAGAEQAIHVLRAEWSYLNDPLRLREQAEHHLNMRPMRANQIVTIDSIPLIGDPTYQPPGMITVRNGILPSHHRDEKIEIGREPHPQSKLQSNKPDHKPVPAGRVITAKAGTDKSKASRSPEVASAKVRP
jgi:hypothetical protein